MALLDVGRVCRKTSGRGAGELCVIVKAVDGGFMVESSDQKQSKISGSHLEPTDQVVSGKDAAKALEKLLK